MAIQNENWRMVDRDDVELREIDERILDLLAEGRCTRQYLAAQLDVTGEYIYQRVDPLIRMGIVEKIHDGFYRLADAEGEESDEETEPVASEPEPAAFGELPSDLQAALDEYQEHCEQHDERRADDRVAAARAIMELLLDDGVGRAEAQEELLPEYAVEGQSDDTWWEKNGKRLLADIESVEWFPGWNEYVYTEE